MTEPLFTILFMGKTGAGKSSTLNALFNLGLKTDNAVACTKVPGATVLSRAEHTWLPDERVMVVDMPGIAESIEANDDYLPFYEEWVPKTHSLVWVTQADTRAYKQDQVFLLKLGHLFRADMRFTVALNRVDHLGVDEGEASFDTSLNSPSDAQFRELTVKVIDVHQVFSDVLEHEMRFEPSDVVPYTAFFGWGLDDLKKRIILRRG